jgi:hypothetical protein
LLAGAPKPSDTPKPLPSDTPKPLPSDTPKPLPGEDVLTYVAAAGQRRLDARAYRCIDVSKHHARHLSWFKYRKASVPGCIVQPELHTSFSCRSIGAVITGCG